MNNVLFLGNNNKKTHSNVIQQVFQLRHETFIDRLGWDITSQNGYETDQFDELSPYHIAIQDDQETVAGCWRALPTTGDYMLESIFPELLQGENAPKDQNIWEISRFAVKKCQDKAIKGYSSQMTIEMMSSLYQFAKTHGVKQYVAVTSVGFERILQKLGLTIRRFGEGKALQIGVEKTVAIWVEVDDNLNIQLH